MVATPKMIGERIKRKEDPRFITGTGKYTDDIQLHGMLHVAVLRSDHAHARIKRIDASKARALPGVVAVYTGKDLEGKVGGVPCGVQNSEGNHYSAGVPLNVPAYLNGAGRDFQRALALAEPLIKMIKEPVRSRRMQSNLAKAYLNRGHAKHGLEDRDGAERDFTRALELNPKLAPDVEEILASPSSMPTQPAP